jgi:hypothetical protein
VCHDAWLDYVSRIDNPSIGIGTFIDFLKSHEPVDLQKINSIIKQQKCRGMFADNMRKIIVQTDIQ